MSRNLFLKEWKLNRGLFIAWALTIAALNVFIVAMIPAWMQNAGAMQTYLKFMPQPMLRAFSMDGLEALNSTLSVFVVYDMLYTTLLGGIYAVSVFAKTLHREQAQGTAEFLMAKPLSRWELFSTKAAASFAQVTAMEAVVVLTGWLSLAILVPPDWSLSGFLVVSLYSFLLMIAFGAMGLLFSLCVKRARSLTGPATGIVLGFYFYDAVAKMDDAYGWLGWLGPFKWVDTAVARPGYGLEAWRVLLFLGVICACLASSWLIYRRKDILS